MTTILLVEDNPNNARLIWEILGQADYSLISAVDGKQGIDIAMFCEPDLILLDLHLPDIHGGTVLQRLREIPKLQSVPVIAVTADAMHGDRERILKMGFDAYVAKPISRRIILNTIQHVLSTRDLKAN